jgi:hypothetical protein
MTECNALFCLDYNAKKKELLDESSGSLLLKKSNSFLLDSE